MTIEQSGCRCAFEKLGSGENPLVRISSQADSQVCADCQAVDGVVIPLDEAKRLIPVHSDTLQSNG